MNYDCFIIITLAIFTTLATIIYFTKQEVPPLLAGVLAGASALPISCTCLFWLLVVFPERSDSFYLIATAMILISVLAFTLKTSWSYIEIKSLTILLIPIAIALLVSRFFSGYYQEKLLGHDIAIYGIEAKNIYAKKNFTDKLLRTDSITSFTPLSAHPPHFALIMVLENLQFSKKTTYTWKDKIIRLTTPFYFALAILALVFSLQLKLKESFLIALLALVNKGAIYQFIIPHIDSIRTFFHLMSFIFLYSVLRKPTQVQIWLLAATCALGAAFHSIGVMIWAAQLIVIIAVFYRDKKTIISTAKANLIFFVLLGPAYYVAQFFNGKSDFL